MPTPRAPSPAVRFITKLIAALCALGFIVYCVDLSWYHFRAAVPRFGAANSSVHRVRMLAIPNKGNKVDYELDTTRPEEDVPCSRSLFPHANESPCWYVRRHASDPIQM